MLLLVIAIGLAGTGAELVAFDHFEDVLQALPVGLIAVALSIVLWNLVAPTRGSVRVMQLVMIAFIVAGGLGIYLHFQGNLAFQLDIDPTQSRWDLFTKVIHAKSPPSLAPGSMAQLGLLGLIWAYRHPALVGSAERPSQGV
jgi:hypothetical protein